MEKADYSEKVEKTGPIVSVSSSSSSTKSETAPPLTGNHHHPSSPGASPQEEYTVVSFEPNDRANPHNWSLLTKSLIFLSAFLSTTTTSFSSTLPSNFSPSLPVLFAVPDPSGPQRVLPASLYLAGFVFGPLVWAPLSESPLVGRWRVLVSAAGLFVVMCLGQAVVREGDWVGFLVLRFFGGVVASPPETNIITRSATTFVGPLGAPILAGYVSTSLGWRAVMWIALSLAVASFIGVLLMPETLASTILRRKAARLNKEFPGTGKVFVAPSDLKQESAWVEYKTTLSRPWHLLFGEMVVSLSCAYLGFVYAVFYMLLQIFPRIFQGVYSFTPGMSGILFTIMGLGTATGCCLFVWYDGVAPRLIAKHPTKREEYLRLPLVCAGGPLYVASMLWLGWSARSDIHWLVPLSSMIPYGLAYHLIYVGIVNYVADAYGIYSASALAAMSMTRSVLGTLLPLAIEDMVDGLGIAWSCTLLAGVSAGLALVPFGFVAYGERIRAASRFSAALKPAAAAAREGGGVGLARVTSLSAV
ncbi:major facilitator superfamily domain-containing protein [Chaetomium fimeti]|uniref:Major facilitator superfamily domain-containing protein n=1 Tax=Chaetomium fimeti TaxID=1854472 RepID=A0AAE0LTQ0_9PEZI|nr:major facilitator superfamily domain-containing protein [Chaetomium fimeti]